MKNANHAIQFLRVHLMMSLKARREALKSLIYANDTLDGDFDDADFAIGDPDSHPDEVVLPAPDVKSHHSNGARNGPGSNGTTPNQTRPSVNRQQPTRSTNVAQGAASNGNNLPQQPQTPNSGFTRSTSGSGPANQMRPPQDSVPRPNLAQPIIAGRVLNQPSRMATGPPATPASPARLPKSQEEEDMDIKGFGMPPPGTGFFSARAAAILPEGATTNPIPESVAQTLPTFNPKLESPSIRKTPGIDHKGTRPVGLKQLAASQPPAAGAGRGNIVNPQMDATRRIGAPGSPSPMANRGQYKPPTVLKRSVDGGDGQARAPLVDLPANGAIGVDVGGDLKRQRLNN